jgi:sterol desaturase/sphingolipid hydroxylase (fatty acid hydroxylase superfamily)
MLTIDNVGLVLVFTTFLAELLLMLREKTKLPVVKGMMINLSIGIFSVLTGFIMKGVSFGWFSLIYHIAFFKPAISWQLWLMGFILYDFVFYLYHWSGHHTRLFWASHVTHHSSQDFNFSVGFRINFIHILYRFLFWSPLCLVGIPPMMILFFESLTTVQNFLIHTEKVKKLGILDFVFNTPSNHRVHHASNPEYLDKNLGGILMLFDHLFGTYKKETTPCIYGITKNIYSNNPATILLHEYRDLMKGFLNIHGWSNKICFLFTPPGDHAEFIINAPVELQENKEIVYSPQNINL